ncbi:MAG: exo-alpha-sialidase, partial [Clostridia bacterium]|nr:exo-alpha-sialidase [Clostridia bacterium]
MKKISFLIVFFVFALLFCLPFQTGKTEAKAEGEFEKMDLGNYWAFWSNFEGVETSRIAPDVKETYAFGDRRWFGLPTVCLTDGGRLWIGFMTGGDGEPHYTNYNAFHYSDDGGVTWSEESLIIEQKNDDIGLYQPHLFMLNGVMQLWLNNGGQNVITIDNPDCDRPSENLHLTRAKKVLPRNAAHRPTILSDKWDNIWLFSGENSNSDSNDIYASANGQKWEIYSSVESSNVNRKWWEGQIVECSDGTLIHVSRLESGADDGVQLAYSYDGGESWTQCAASNGRPFTSYSNKC